MSTTIRPAPIVTPRLITGLVISAAVHLLIVLGISPGNPAYVPSLTLQVELQREAAPGRVATLPTEQLSQLPAQPVAVAPPPPALPTEPQAPSPPAAERPARVPLPLDKYYTAHEVDVRAEQINEVNLIFPRMAYQMRVKGKVVLRIFINEQGGIDDVAIVRASPAGTFEEAALTAALALQFKPAIKNGRNVKSLKTIEVAFDPYESINIP